MHPSRPLFHTAGSVGPFQSSTSSSSSNFPPSPFTFHPQGNQFHLPTTSSSSFIPFHDGSQRTMFGMVQGEGSQYRSTAGVWSSSASSSSTTFNPLRQDSMYQPRAIDLQHGVASAMHKADWYTATSDESSYSPEPESTQSTALIRSKMLELPTFYPNKSFTASNATSAAFHDDPSSSLKQLSLTPSHQPSSSTLGRGETVRHHHLGSLLVSVPAALSLDLPLMPIFLESTNFSCRNIHLAAPNSVHDDQLVEANGSQCTPAQAWAHVQECLKKTGTLTAQPKQFQLSCSTTVGTSTVDFNVRCYRGHYRSCAPPAILGGESSSDDSAAAGADEWFTFEFQRQSGCCVTTWQLFKHVLRSFIDTFGEKSIECAVTVDKKDQLIEADVDGPGHAEPAEDNGEGSSSMNETDLAAAGLSIPSLIPSLSVPQLKRSCSVEGAPAKSLEDDDTFCTSLLDMLTSSCESSQLDGLNALACYLDDAASNPLSSTLLCEVARKLQSSSDCQANMTVAASPCVQRIATSILERASQMPTLAGQVSQHCLPKILASLREQQSNVSQSDAQRCIQSAHRLSTQKNLLRSCINLSGACNSSFDMEGGPIAHSQLKRQLLRMTSHSDDEVRGLATETIRAISV